MKFVVTFVLPSILYYNMAVEKKKKNLREKERTQSSLSQISVFGFCLDQSYRRQNDMPKIVFGLD